MSVIVVTGAERGMGRACVDRLRSEAEHVVAVDLAPPSIATTHGVGCDVSDPAAVADLVETVREMGDLAALVHAAGISPTMAEPRRIFEVDLLGTQLLLDAFEPLVVADTTAVCFASSSAYHVTLLGPNAVFDSLVEDPTADGFLDAMVDRIDDSGLAYAWAKRGVIRSAARAAVTWGHRGGRVTSISPGLIDTGMAEQEAAAQPMMQVMLDATPVGRLGRPAEIAELVAFLISERAGFLSGTDVLVDGGGFEGLRAQVTLSDA